MRVIKRGAVALLTALVVAALTLVFIGIATREAGDGYNFSSWSESRPVDQASEDEWSAAAAFDLEGNPILLSALWADKPLVIETGSKTCPIYLGMNKSMSDLVGEFKQNTRFVLLYVREAHPGLFNREHRSIEQKFEAAHSVAHRSQAQVLVDDLAGSIHKKIGGGPNSVVILDRSGRVVHSSFWMRPDRVATTLNHLKQNDGYLRDESIIYRNDRREPDHISKFGMLKAILGISGVGGPDALLDFILNVNLD